MKTQIQAFPSLKWVFFRLSEKFLAVLMTEGRPQKYCEERAIILLSHQFCVCDLNSVKF